MAVTPHHLARAAGTAVRVILLGLFAAAIYRAALTAWADSEYRTGTPQAIGRAERLMPSNAVYHYTNALLREQNEPVSPAIESEFAAAVARSPRYSDALMAWSVEKELRGDKNGAEELLLDAQRKDHLLRPTWALANFYFRQGDTDRFFKEARESLRIIGASGLSEGRFDPGPIFALCWKSGADASTILDRAIPPDRPILGSYFNYLVATGNIPAIEQCASRLLPDTGKGELFLLAPYVNLLINRNLMSPAIQAWEQLFKRGAVPFPGPDPANGVFLTNADLAAPPSDFGFDWRRVFPDTVQFTFSKPDHSYRFDFDGNQPEHFSLLYQPFPLQPGRAYRFTARFHSDGNPQQSGLWWSFTDHKDGHPIPGKVSVISTGAAPTDEEKTLTLDFDASANTDSADIHLDYNRQPGTERFRGFYELLHVGLKLR